MPTGEFEVEFPSTLLSGTISADVHEVNEPPSHIIDINDPWIVDIDWTLSGSVLPMVNGTWCIDGYMESMGPGTDFELPNEPPDIPLNPSNGVYHAQFQVPAGTVPPFPGETDAVYKLVVTVTYRNTLGVPGPIAGFVEIPMLHFYQDLQP